MKRRFPFQLVEGSDGTAGVSEEPAEDQEPLTAAQIDAIKDSGPFFGMDKVHRIQAEVKEKKLAAQRKKLQELPAEPPESGGAKAA